MNLFSIFKKKKSERSSISPNDELQCLIDYIPDFYKQQRQYINAREFLSHGEWGLTLESLVELIDETGHYFSEEFLNRIADLGKQINLLNINLYCLEQIKRNERDIKCGTPFGWTTAKIDEAHFKHHISEKIKEKWLTKRHIKDGVKELLKKDGIYLKMNGRAGTLYIVDRQRLAEVDIELGMKALLLYFRATTYWLLPAKQLLTEQERHKIKQMIRSWASEKKEAIEFDD